MVLKKIAEALSGSSVQRCPQCDHPIAYESINIKEGVACCDPCRKLFRLSELNWSHRSREEVLAQTPLGCSKVEWGQSLTLIDSNVYRPIVRLSVL
jgi:uncharacterized paraquat-inducible protein A